MTDILVTGATGFIGSHVVHKLNENGIRPRILVRPTSNRANLEGMDADIVIGDLAEPETLPAAVDGIEYLYHIAGYVSPRPSERARMFASNAEGAANIIDAAVQVGVKRIVYLGSVTALGASEEPCIWQEGDPYNLGGMNIGYFDSKKMGETVVRERIAAGAPVVSVYPAYCLGPGDVYLSSSNMVVYFVQGKLPFYTEAGMGFLDVRDAAESMILAMEKGTIGQRYFISGHNLTYKQFFDQLAVISGKAPPNFKMPLPLLKAISTVTEPLTDGLPFSRSLYMCLARYYWYDNTKAEQELGWTYRSVDDLLEGSLTWLAAAGHI